VLAQLKKFVNAAAHLAVGAPLGCSGTPEAWAGAEALLRGEEH